MGEHDEPRGVGEEATAQPEGVGTTPTAEPGGVARETKPTATGGEPQAAQPGEKLNLDDLPEFRRWKAGYDQRMAQAEKRAQDAEARATSVASRLEELELRELGPGEQAAWYRTKLAEERAALERERKAQEEARALSDQATKLLKELGLSADTPGLEWGETPSPENLARLAASAARIVAAQTRQQTQQEAEQTEEQLRAARIGALNEAGVTRTSVATAGAPPGTSPVAAIDDPSTLLRMGTERALRERKGRPSPRG